MTRAASAVDQSPGRLRAARVRGQVVVLHPRAVDPALTRPAAPAFAPMPPLPEGWGQDRRDPPGLSEYLGDPAGDWRRQGRFLDAAIYDGLDAPDGPEVLHLLDAAARLDVWFAVCEWAALCSDPQVRAFSRLMVRAGEAVLRGDKDVDGGAVPLGRMLGIQPASGATATTKIRLRRRDKLLRIARGAIPAAAAGTPRQAATIVLAALERYRGTGWHRDRDRASAPAT